MSVPEVHTSDAVRRPRGRGEFGTCEEVQS